LIVLIIFIWSPAAAHHSTLLRRSLEMASLAPTFVFLFSEQLAKAAL
jgi:hypothetical protein